MTMNITANVSMQAMRKELLSRVMQTTERKEIVSMNMKRYLWMKAELLQSKIISAAKLAERTGDWKPWEEAWTDYEIAVAEAKVETGR